MREVSGTHRIGQRVDGVVDLVECHIVLGHLVCRGMSINARRTVAGVLGLMAAFVGFWAAVGPASWYQSFPLPGRHWVSALGPYNEHLARDVGGLYLALFVISAWAVLRPQPETFRLTGAAWLAFSIPHLAFHLLHLDMFTTPDKIGNIVALAGAVVLAAALLLPRSAARDREARVGEQAPTV